MAKKAPQKKVPLANLPVAKGRPRGKKCYVCGETKGPSDFAYALDSKTAFAPLKVHRTCVTCVVTGRTRLFQHKCPACGKVVKSSSNRPTCCSDACRAKRIKKSEKARAARRKTRASRRDRRNVPENG